ncbi:twin-arginine translocation signal domain-containing protein [Enterobacter kobei]|uniref:twin-arginine translocation signal domain-containing protein n=1 Tax=Enterobacter kobei TaxID=208224 RepID=UPI003F773EA9
MKINAPEELLAAEVTRRGLMKTAAIGGLAVASSAFTLPFTRLASAADALSPVSVPEKWCGVPVR